jgi:hypothetical protein
VSARGETLRDEMRLLDVQRRQSVAIRNPGRREEKLRMRDTWRILTRVGDGTSSNPFRHVWMPLDYAPLVESKP